MFPLRNPMLHYTLNVPYQYAIFKQILKKEKIDVVVAAHIFAGTAVIRAAKKYGVPVVFDLKDWFPDSAAAYYNNNIIRETIRKTVLAITRYNLNRSDVITTVSPALVDKLGGYGYHAKLITNGVDTSIFKPMDKHKKIIGCSDTDFVLGFVGSVERWYDLNGIISDFPKILKYNKNVKLLIVGDSLFTDYRFMLEQKVRELKIEDSVAFTGIVEHSQLPKYIAAMDVGLIPLAPMEWCKIAMPDKFFEYSACGKPVLSTPIPCIEDIKTDNLFVYNNQEEFMNHIMNLMDNRDRTYHIDMKKYDWKRKAEEFEILFEDVIAFKKREPLIVIGEYFKNLKKG